MADEARAHEARPRLGRGLAALLGETAEPPAGEPGRGQRRAPVEFLRPNPRNPRKSFADADLDELAASIRERGVLQPVLVRAIPRVADAYEIIAGERRWRAAQRAGLHEVPINVIEAGDREALELAIVENVQRADLNALEEAAGYQQLANDYGHSHADIARIIGKSRSHIANTLRLTGLPEYARGLLANGKLTAGHARALLATDKPDALADRIVEEGLSVRDVERIVQKNTPKPLKSRVPSQNSADADTRALEAKLAAALGARVAIRHDGESGELRLQFASFEQLDDFCRRLSRSPE